METVKLIECPRDAWQGLPDFIPTEYKAQYLKKLILAGFKHIDAVSFVSPKHVKQMADSEDVMAKLNASLSGRRRTSGNYRHRRERKRLGTCARYSRRYYNWLSVFGLCIFPSR